MRRIVIWGCGGHAREINVLCEELGYTVVGFLDERPDMKGRTVDGVSVLGDIDQDAVRRLEAEVVCAGVGDPRTKARFLDRTLAAGFTLARPIIHRGTYVSGRNVVADGVVICAGVTMTTNIRLDANVCLNRAVTVGHDAVIGAHATVNPGAVISGQVTVGEGAYIGANAAIRERIAIGDWAVVGGGAFVCDDVPAGITVAGVPAKPLRTRPWQGQ